MPNTSLKKGIILLLLSFLGLQQLAGAQKHFLFLKINEDTIPKIRHPYPDPKKAMLYSVILPGLGQAYNKKWWKLGLVYAGLGTCAYFAITNQQQYKLAHDALVDIDNNKPNPYPYYNATDLFSIQNYYSRNRDLSYIVAAFIYVLNIVDANVDAQLHNFDISDNISFRFAPQLYADPTGKCNIQPGLCLIKRF